MALMAQETEEEKFHRLSNEKLEQDKQFEKNAQGCIGSVIGYTVAGVILLILLILFLRIF